MRRAAVFLVLFSLPAAAHAAVARVVDAHLEVDGKPFLVKGVGCNTAAGDDGTDYLRMARDLGANSVRTWGTTPKTYFDKAQSYGLLVDAGIWFNPIRGTTSESYKDAAYCAKLKSDALSYVHAAKGHPALLSWNLGNEVFNFTESDEEREAFAVFLEDLAKAVKREDPDHPIVYACASGKDVDWIHRLVPSVDIVGINTYGGYRNLAQRLAGMGDKRPVLATEYGPRGGWDVKKDTSGLPFEPDDHSKASQYADLWKTVSDPSFATLGGYAFVLGDTRNQDSLTWWNINYADLKREGYWAVYTAYTGKEPKNHAPRIRLFKVSRVTELAPGEEIDLETTAADPDGDKLSYGYLVTDIAADPLIVEPTRTYPISPVAQKPDRSKVRIRVPNDPGVYRVYALVKDGRGNVAVATRGLKVVPPRP